MQSLFAAQALTAEGWQQNLRIDIDAGIITAITAGNIGASAYDLILPGMPNLHSHAFQRAMAGLTEYANTTQGQHDNFWSWREAMYHFLERLTPEHVEIIAQAFYIELLKNGYTAVGEFHYLHHDISGRPYTNPAEMSERIIAAAHYAGIHLTLLPVLYQTSNFGGIEAVSGQRRFLHSTPDYLKLVDILKTQKGIVLGIAPHSLRAVPPEALEEILAAFPEGPIHLHAAEQEKEVADCLEWSGKRSVEWLLENHYINERWCLIHATHLSAEETSRLAASDAVAGLCPSTEANLGDGIFPAEAYLNAHGRFGIGSDSHITVNPFEELKLMEYAQRLLHRRRNVLCSAATPSVGQTLYQGAVAGGAQALGMHRGGIAVGCRADLIALDTSSPLLADKKGSTLLDTLIFGTSHSCVTDVFVAGNHIIKNGHHPLEESSNHAMREVMREILSA